MAWGGGRAEWDPPQRTAQGLTSSSGPGYGGVEMRLNGTCQIRCFLGPTRNGVVMSCINRLTDQAKAADNLGNFLVNESKIIKPAQFVCIVPRPKLGRMYLKSTWCMHWPAEKKTVYIIPIVTGAQKGKLEVGKITWPAITYGYAVSAFFSYHTMAYEILYPCRLISSYRK